VYFAVIEAWGWPLLGSYRTGVAILGFIGIAMCASGSQVGEGKQMRAPLTVAISFLGAAALVLVVWGLIVVSEAVFTALAIDIVVLWAITTLRHAAGTLAVPRPRPVH